jgi:hypothetical protein
VSWPNTRPASGKSEGQSQGKVKIGLFSMMPRRFFASGTAASIGPSAALLLLALCEHANRNNGNTFKASDNALAADTGLGTRTICDARKTLSERNLISCLLQKGQSYVYTLPVYEFEWIQLKDRPRKRRKPRAIHAKRMAETLAKFAEPIMQAFAEPPRKLC